VNFGSLFGNRNPMALAIGPQRLKPLASWNLSFTTLDFGITKIITARKRTLQIKRECI